MQRFEKTVDSLYAIDTLAVAIVQNNRLVKDHIKAKNSKTTKKVYPSYNCYPTTDPNVKAVSIQWDGIVYNMEAPVSYMRVIVDIKEQKVKKIEDTEIKGNWFYE